MLARPLAARQIHETDEESNGHDDDEGLSDDNDSSSGEDLEMPMRPHLSDANSYEHASEDGADDEPPEIPGSPMAQVVGSLGFAYLRHRPHH